MSRVGKKPTQIPDNVEVTIAGQHITVKGPKGTLELDIHPKVTVKQEENELIVTVEDETEKLQRSLWGLFARLVRNMVIGVTEGFSKQLEIIGVGYRVALAGNILTFNVGYSHQIEFKLAEGIEAKVEKNVITISGIDKHLVGEMSAQIRKIRKPEPYKGKGIKYMDEHIKRKVGKAAGKAA